MNGFPNCLPDIGLKPQSITCFLYRGAEIAVCPNLSQASSAAAQCDQQGRDDHNRRNERNRVPAGFRRQTAADQQDVGNKHSLDHGGVAETASHRLLVIMLTMRLPYTLATQQPASEGDRRIGEIVKRQYERDLPETANGQ